MFAILRFVSLIEWMEHFDRIASESRYYNGRDNQRTLKVRCIQNHEPLDGKRK
jgi:hypothetical protein